MKFKIAAEGVPTFSIITLVPGSPVVTVPIAIVAASPAGPCGPTIVSPSPAVASPSIRYFLRSPFIST